MADTIKVLYVDDEEDLLTIGRIFLQKYGEFIVDTASSAQKALQNPGIRTYDAIISDYQMPGMDGILFLKEVRRKIGTIPFILFTGKGREEIVIEALNNGADFYLQKGGEPKAQFTELAHKIHQAVDRRRIESSLVESEKRLSEIINFLPDATFAIDRSGTVIAWNRAIEEMTGWLSADMVGKADYEYAIPFYGVRRSILIDLVFHSDDEIRLHYSFVRSDGHTLTAETVNATPIGKQCVLWGTAAPLLNSDGEIVGAIESIRDITESKNAKERLQISEELYRSIVTDQEDFIFRFTPDGTITFVNEAFRLHLAPGPDPGEITGKKISDLMLPGSIILTDHLLNGITPQSPHTWLENELQGHDGRRYWIHWSVRSLYNADGALVEYQVVGRDITEKKQVEQEIAKSRKYLDQIFSSVQAGIMIIDAASHKIVDINPAGASLIGLPKEQIIGLVCHRFICPAEKGQCPITDLHNPVDNSERILINHAGKKIPIIKYVTWVHLEGRDCLLETFIDNSERKRAKDALRESERKYHDLIQLLPQMVFETDLNLQVTFANHHAQRILGISIDDIQNGVYAYSLIDPAQREKMIEWARYIANNQDFEPEEYSAVRADGTLFPVSIYPSIIYQNGTASSFRAIVMDITQRKKAEDELRQTSSELQQIFSNMINAFVIWDSVFDTDGMYVSFRFQYFNDAYARLTNLRLEDVKGKDIFEIWPETEQSWVDIYGQIALTGTPQVFDMYHEPTRGWYHCNAYRPTDLPDKVCVIFEDITERRMKEDALHLINKKLQLLSGITRHDIINQISVLDGCLDIIHSDCTAPESEHYFSQMETAIDQITHMIRFTQEYEQIGVQAPKWQNLHLLVHDAGSHFKEEEIYLENNIPDTVEIFTDPLIQKVFFNLIENAIRHGGKVTCISFSCECSEDGLTIICADDGEGVLPEVKERIFERGFGKNTGFGLYISREILNITDIMIRECGIPGQGARFEILVPKEKFRRTR